MAMGKFSPGVGGAPDQYFRSNTRTRFPRSQLVSGQRVAIQPSGAKGSMVVRLELIGWRTLVEDGEAFNEILNNLAYMVTGLAGKLVRNTAQIKVPKDTWDTFNSMAGDPWMSSEGDSYIATIGPTTFYAPFLEFGTVKMSPRPFLWPAADMHEVDFTNGLIDAMAIAIGDSAHIRTFSDDLQGYIAKARKRLYSQQKAMGDVMSLGIGRGALRPVRASMLRTARGLGDLNAVIGNTLGARFTRRISGRLTGRGLGLSRTISASTTYGGSFAGGTAGQRVYNRVVGRQTSGIAGGGFGFG
jgi:HK97 gp10 family phage protein